MISVSLLPLADDGGAIEGLHFGEARKSEFRWRTKEGAR